MTIRKGQKTVNIDPALLPQIDLGVLNHKLIFRVDGPPHSEVIVSRDTELNEIVCEVRIATNDLEWPDDDHEGSFYADAYATILAIAVGRQPNGNDHDGEDGFIHGVAGNITHFILYRRLPVSGEQILETLNRKLDRMFANVNNVLTILAAGPQVRIQNPVPDEELGEE